MKILWVPLPKERRPDGRLVLSVLVSPRLDTDGVLGDVDRMIHWPEYVNELEFNVIFDGSIGTGTEREPIDPKWWYKLFTPETPLQAHTLPDYSETLVHTFPVRNILGFVESTYKHFAEAASTDFPAISDLQQRFADIPSAIELNRHEDIYQSEITWTPGRGQPMRRALNPGFSIGGLDPVASDFIQAYGFYRRFEQEMTREHTEAPKRPEVIRPDFHRMLAFLGDSPELMRHLGLIVDLEFEDPGVSPEGMVRIEVNPYDPGIDLTPSTAYEMYDDHFLTRPGERGFLIEKGTLRLDSMDLFDFYQLDIDGAALKLVDYAASLSQHADLPDLASATPGQTSLPSLRTGGFTVGAWSRAQRLVQGLDSATALNADVEHDSAELFLEDLLRGYRLDVWDSETGQWHSLQERVGDHHFHGADGSGPEDLKTIDEGFVRADAATSTRVDLSDPGDPKPGKSDLYLHEALFGWDGWSLAAPRPGKIIVEPGEGDEDEDGEQTELTTEKVSAETDLKLESVYRVADGTLPRLRFGNWYRIRARAVDLAGNGLAYSPDDLTEWTTEERRYLRYEPAASPVVVRRHPDTEGESLERMVIRSDRGLTPAQYVALPQVAAASANLYAEDSHRHIAPPKGAVQTAELHGRLDAAFGPGGDPASTYRLAAKEEGTFLDVAVVDPATGTKDIDVLGDIRLHPPENAPDPATLARGAGLPEGVYLYRPGPALVPPYLPDPLAVGAAFHNLPGHPGSTLVVPYQKGNGVWWDLRPFRLRMVGIDKYGLAGAGWLDDELVVTVPQGHRVVARVSTAIDKDGRETLAIWDLISSAARAALEKESLEGRMWMLTPYRPLEFVHAVQRPLEDPVIQFTPDRLYGETFTGFKGTIANHARSTGRIDVRAVWTEPIDSGVKDELPADGISGPLPSPKTAVAFGWELAEHEDNAAVKVGQQRVSRHELGDTRHRKVRYHPVATTRFREYFPESIIADAANITAEGPEVELSIPNSARPDPPRVMYVIPTFRWEEDVVRMGTRRTRKGGGLRVYLDRPWYSSGEGELLGVVTLPTPKRVLPDLVIQGEAIAVERYRGLLRERLMSPLERAELAVEAGTILAFPVAVADAQPYVTTMGKDPTWASADPKATVAHTSFPLRTPESRSGLTIAEAPGATVAVAAHPVSYDPDRELWYSDIELSPDPAYFPFVRLALARFQPESVSNAHLSPVVLSDFIQLTADRTATVTLSGGLAAVTLTGIGPHNIVAKRVHPDFFGTTSGAMLNNSRRVTVVLQQRDPGVQSDMAWKDAGAEVVLELASTRATMSRTWRGKVPVPAETPAPGTHRLLIREYESFFTDWDADIHAGFVEVGIPGKPIGFVRSRVVYVDTFAL
jgi:hypothetical protein